MSWSIVSFDGERGFGVCDAAAPASSVSAGSASNRDVRIPQRYCADGSGSITQPFGSRPGGIIRPWTPSRLDTDNRREYSGQQTENCLKRLSKTVLPLVAPVPLSELSVSNRYGVPRSKTHSGRDPQTPEIDFIRPLPPDDQTRGMV